ncbi:MAG: dipeptidase PepV [Christensenellaceae bacterium]
MLDFSLASRKNEMIDALSKLIGIKSVKSEAQGNMPYGKGVFDALIKTLNIAEHMDFDSVNYFSHLGYVEYGDGEDVFAVLAHLDVVPAGDGWSVPPFEATIKDGKLYGRGAQDNKGPAIAALFALSAIKENCVSLNKRVRIIFGCDEESGWSDIDFYKKNCGEIPTMAISPDAEFPIINAEKGMVQLSLKKEKYETEKNSGLVLQYLNGGDRVNVVPDVCECKITGNTEIIKQMAEVFNEGLPVAIKTQDCKDGIILTANGVSAHGSKPECGQNAVAYMMMFLNTLPLFKNYISDMVYKLAEVIGLQTDGQYLGIKSEDFSGALTLNMGYVHTTMTDIEVGLDIRYPIHSEKQTILDAIKEKLGVFECKEVFALPSHYVSEDSPLVKGLKLAYEEVTGEQAYCIAMGGATYARAFENSVAFGALFPGQKATEHQPDEYIEIDSLVKMADIIANAIVVLCK